MSTDLERYRDAPVAFARDFLGVEPWSRQAEILEAIAKHDRVAVRSSHKVGKSLTDVIAALWFVATREGARVVMTAPTFNQVKSILWRELSMRWLHRVEGKPLSELLGGSLPRDPTVGLNLANGSQIFGVSTSKPENLAGISGPEMLFVIDEASGFEDHLFQVIRGNVAGGAKILATSNPTRAAGWFFDAFRSGEWSTLHVHALEVPNVVKGEEVIPGLATKDWVEEMQRECGAGFEEHPVYQVRVAGEFPRSGANVVVPLHLLEKARQRYERSRPRASEPLRVGVDPKRFGDDDAAIQPVIGHHAFVPLVVSRAISGAELADEVVGVIRQHRSEGDPPALVNVDGGGIGAGVVEALQLHPAHHQGEFRVVELEASRRATDERYPKLRDQLWFGITAWLREGGCLPPDPELERELSVATYSFDALNRQKVIGKDQMRRQLKRSPNRADALALAVHRDGVPVEPDFDTDADQPRGSLRWM